MPSSEKLGGLWDLLLETAQVKLVRNCGNPCLRTTVKELCYTVIFGWPMLKSYPESSIGRWEKKLDKPRILSGLTTL